MCYQIYKGQRDTLSEVSDSVTEDRNLLVSLEGVGVEYRISRRLILKERKPALKSVSLQLYQGDSLGIVGRNGAGKSTLLKLIAGIISPDTGVTTIRARRIAILALQVGFMGHLDGISNAYLCAMLLGFSKKEVSNRIQDIIEFSELGDSIHNPVKTYSHGMRARLGFSVLHYMQPDILLIDEVLGVGDYEFREKSVAAMKERIKSDQTVVLVSHQADTVKQLCNRAVWVEDGVTQMEGDVAEVVEAYQSYIVANPPK